MENFTKHFPLSNFDIVSDIRYILFLASGILFGDIISSLTLNSNFLNLNLSSHYNFPIGWFLVWIVLYGLFMFQVKFLRSILKRIFIETVTAIRIDSIDRTARFRRSNSNKKERKSSDNEIIGNSDFIFFWTLKSYAVLTDNAPAFMYSHEVEMRVKNEEMIRDYYFAISILILLSLLTQNGSLISIIDQFSHNVIIEYVVFFTSMLMMVFSLRYGKFSTSHIYLSGNRIDEKMQQFRDEKKQMAKNKDTAAKRASSTDSRAPI